VKRVVAHNEVHYTLTGEELARALRLDESTVFDVWMKFPEKDIVIVMLGSNDQE
jgi:hypothetical protein